MKKSRIMLLGATTVILLVLLVLISIFRISADKFIKFSNDPNLTVEPSGVMETRSFSYTDFDSIHFESVWDVVVRQSDEYSISISADRALLDVINVDKNGKTVNFSYEKYLKGGSGSDHDFKVDIAMPDLEKIEFTGMGNILIKDFIMETLNIHNSGASNIEAENVTIKQLNLKIDGAANAQLSNIAITNCYLDISGAANIALNMNGGELTGKVSGAASVVYEGSVSKQSVNVSGIGSLEQK